MLDVPKTIVTAGNNGRRGISTIVLSVVNQTGKKNRMCFFNSIVLGPGRHMFSSPVAIKRGTATMLEDGNSHLRKSGAVLSLL